MSPAQQSLGFGQLADQLRVQSRAGRLLVAVAGEPGAGKSTFVRRLAADLDRLGVSVGVLPMDGFHLSSAVLDQLGRRRRKGAIDTFDADGYVQLLRRVRRGEPRTIYAPSFDHGRGEPIAGSIAIEPDCAVVLTEGNYLLDPSEPWSQVLGLADHAWYARVDDALRRQRLIARHIATGKTPEAATRWAAEVDERNAERIRTTATRAHLILRLDDPSGGAGQS